MSFHLDLFMAHTAKYVWSDNLGQLAQFYMYEILLSGSTDNLAQMAQKVSFMPLKQITHLLSTDGVFSQWMSPCNIIGDSHQVWHRCSPSYI